MRLPRLYTPLEPWDMTLGEIFEVFFAISHNEMRKIQFIVIEEAHKTNLKSSQ